MDELLIDRVSQAQHEEQDAERKRLLADCYASLVEFRIVISQVRNARAVMSQISFVH